MDIDLLKPAYSQQDIAIATDIPAGRIRNWVARNYPIYARNDRLAERGSRHLLSGATAVRIALIDAMAAMVSIDVASRAADKFELSGAGKTPNSVATRNPYGLFEEGETFLFVQPEKTDVVCRLPDGQFHLHLPTTHFFVQPVDDIWFRVVAKLERLPVRRAPDDDENLDAPRKVRTAKVNA